MIACAAMPRMRSVTITIEAETSLTTAQLKQLKSLVFISLKGNGRRSIRSEPPHQACRIANSDCCGEIKQVQVNVIK